MKKWIKSGISVLLAVILSISGLLNSSVVYAAATAPTKLWIEPTETNGIPAQIDVWKANLGTTQRPNYQYQIYLPGNVDPADVFLSWDSDATVTVGGTTYQNGNAPIPEVNTGTAVAYAFKNGTQTLATFNVIAYKGSPSVSAIFIDVDESNGNPTIAQMDGDSNHEVTCTGRINIDGQWYDMPKMKGRGNATWSNTKDKKPYNVTLDSKVTLGLDTPATKKWTLLAEAFDHSLLSNRSGFYLAHELGIGQDTKSADVWMNGEYQGCYTITPKTDSFVTKNGYMVEQDNYQEASVANGGDPQFLLDGFKENMSWGSSGYNRFTVKDMGDNLLKVDGVVDESVENIEHVAYDIIKPWLQDAWDTIRHIDGVEDGYNAKGDYYTDYIDLESFAKMYLMHEYVKSYDVCAGSILYHRDGDTDADKLIAGPLWDLDNAMGSTCSNSGLGSQSDRRSAQGSFIAEISEYKTSVYKNIGMYCPGFLDEVEKQYNKYRDSFDALPGVVDQMIQDIEDSAKMNHIKVTDLG
ncbi:MAG: CotH kinase family protein, partial [Erysipelotrichaceae bacterium]|nr:CotH kinase family protein [Erysipelotrichaceae bacterium]